MPTLPTKPPPETLYAYLERRERELLNLTTAMRGDLEAAENELAHVQSAKRQIGNLGGADKARFGVPQTRLGQVSATLDDLKADVGMLSALVDDSSSPTIKQLIMKALWSGFRENGATPSDLRQYILDAYGRNVHPSSMSPQLSRLKAEGLLKQKDGDRWYLTKAAKAAESRERVDLRFTVAKPFNSLNQRFPVGMELKFKDIAELETFKKNILPVDFESMRARGFLEAKAEEES